MRGAKTRANTRAKPAVDEKREVSSDDDPSSWDDACHRCKLSGKLICCDGCKRAFHSGCRIKKIPKLLIDKIDSGEFTGKLYCDVCTSQGKKSDPWPSDIYPPRRSNLTILKEQPSPAPVRGDDAATGRVNISPASAAVTPARKEQTTKKRQEAPVASSPHTKKKTPAVVAAAASTPAQQQQEEEEDKAQDALPTIQIFPPQPILPAQARVPLGSMVPADITGTFGNVRPRPRAGPGRGSEPLGETFIAADKCTTFWMSELTRVTQAVHAGKAAHERVVQLEQELRWRDTVMSTSKKNTRQLVRELALYRSGYERLYESYVSVANGNALPSDAFLYPTPPVDEREEEYVVPGADALTKLYEQEASRAVDNTCEDLEYSEDVDV